MKTLAFLPFFCLLLTAATAQTSVEGSVADSSGFALPSATVMLLQARDSVLVAFGMTDADGRFRLDNVPAGLYALQASCIGYQAGGQTLTVPADKTSLRVGRILLTPASVLLQGVEIKAEAAPLVMRRDTLEYNAGAFKTQPGAVVEDLLKKLPGIQVQTDGTIKAQGETVQNVLVDGKEFFGQDPKIATKNLPADAVGKVQVYDKKSEQAEFTGIDDGREQKTINLQLKPDKKQGYFGNASAGYGTRGRFEGKFNVNRFGGKTQFSALGMANNTNQQGFSFEDYINFMGGLSNMMAGSGGSGGRVRITLNPEESGIPMGSGLENGFTTTWAGGMNVHSDLTPKTQLSANYFYSRLQNRMERTATRTNVLGDRQFGSTEAEDRLSRTAGHRLNVTLRHKPDSASNLILRGNLNFTDAYLTSRGQTVITDTLGAAQNTGLRDYFSDGGRMQGNAELIYRRHLGRKGRSLVAQSSFQRGDDDRTGNLRARNDYGSGSQILHQRQNYDDRSTRYGASLAYTEPLGRRQYLEAEMARQEYADRTGKDFYDVLETPTPGEIFNPLLSNRFRRGYRYDRATLNYLLNRKNYNLTAGTALQHARLDGEVPESQLPALRRDFTRLLPSAFFNYDVRAGRNFSAEYTTELREPSLEQLQPVVDNSDPLNVYVGNPGLLPEYAHNLELHGLLFDQFSMTSIFANVRATYSRNHITNAGSVDSLFRRTLRPVNVPQDFLLNTYFNFSTPLRPLKTNFQIAWSATYNRGILFVNEQENRTDRWINSVDLTFDNRKKEKIDASIGFRLTQNATRYSASKALNQTFVTQTYFTDATWYVTPKWTLNTALDYTFYSGEVFGGARAVPLWRASLTRYVLKNNKGQIKLAAFDLLNRNVGISRTSELNYLEEVGIRNLSRYFTLSFAYALSGFGRKAEQGGLRIDIRH